MKNRFAVYLGMQLKRSGKLIPFVLCITFLVLACVYLLGGMIADMDENGEHRQKMRIGVVGEMDDPYINLAVSALQNLDSSRFSISFERMEEADARTLLKTGQINAYIIMPEGFVEAAMYGENEPITYVTTDGAVGIGSIVMNEVAGAVSEMVLESQNAVFGMRRYIREEGVDADMQQLTDRLCERYLIKILKRTDMYELETVGLSGGVSFIGYYVCGIAVLFLLLWGMSCSPLFVNRDLSLCRVLAAKGQKIWKQVLAEYLAYFLLMLASLLCVALVAVAALEFTGYSLPEWEGDAVSSAAEFFVSLLPVIAMVSAMQFLLYEAVSGPVNSILLQFLSAAGMGYISGCFYPINFFPESMRRLGSVLPSGVGREYLIKGLTEAERGVEFAAIAAFFALFLALSAVIRKKKIS